jgi:cytochrome c-type biogenesis protein CcmF
MTGEPAPAALAALVQRNRRRYGGYVVHAGMAILFVGVAASSAFQANRDLRLRPGQTARVGGYDVTYVRPTTRLESEKVSLGAVLDVRRDGKRVGTLRPTRGYFPSTDPTAGPVGRFFDGQATSEVGLQAGLRRDLWTAVEPDLQPLEPLIRQADAKFGDARPQLQAFLIAAVAERWRTRPPPATFRVIASPLVTWIWIGALIVIAGALIAMWPAPVAARRRARAGYAARVARELGRA